LQVLALSPLKVPEAQPEQPSAFEEEERPAGQFEQVALETGE